MLFTNKNNTRVLQVLESKKLLKMKDFVVQFKVRLIPILAPQPGKSRHTCTYTPSKPIERLRSPPPIPPKTPCNVIKHCERPVLLVRQQRRSVGHNFLFKAARLYRHNREWWAAVVGGCMIQNYTHIYVQAHHSLTMLSTLVTFWFPLSPTLVSFLSHIFVFLNTA